MRKLLTLSLALLLLITLAAPVSAAGTPYIIDDADLLTYEEQLELNGIAHQIADTYRIGVYIMTVPNYLDYGDEYQIFDVLWNYYHDNGLGYGPNREGMILMLSMAERDYATFFYGDRTEYAFDSYGQEELESYFLDDLGNDDWYHGFMNYLYASEDFLVRAEAGDPVRESPWPLALLFVGIACFLSFIVTMLLWNKMKNVSIQQSAAHYATSGLVLTRQRDQFLYQNVRRRKVETGSSGGRSHSGGGGSGRSGKF
ncbi:MAG: TPM domain-containing protein [Oscillospiraceae bacterium]|nr:TPM domain-containing protein [Oscillospiraceae bacterium]